MQEEEIEENEKKNVKKYFPCELGVIVIIKEWIRAFTCPKPLIENPEKSK